MKKMFLHFLLLLTLSYVIGACGKEEPIGLEGNWKVATFTNNGIDIFTPGVYEQDYVVTDLTLALKTDGTCNWEIKGKDEEGKLNTDIWTNTYTKSGSVLILSNPSHPDWCTFSGNYSIIGNTLTWSGNNTCGSALGAFVLKATKL